MYLMSRSKLLHVCIGVHFEPKTKLKKLKSNSGIRRRQIWNHGQMENGAIIQMNRALGKNILHPLSCVVVDKGFYTTWTA